LLDSSNIQDVNKINVKIADFGFAKKIPVGQKENV